MGGRGASYGLGRPSHSGTVAGRGFGSFFANSGVNGFRLVFGCSDLAQNGMRLLLACLGFAWEFFHGVKVRFVLAKNRLVPAFILLKVDGPFGFFSIRVGGATRSIMR